MKNKSTLLIFSTALVVCFLFTGPCFASEKTEWYTPSVGDGEPATTDQWLGQTFEATSTYTITSVKLTLYENGSGANFYANLFAINGENKPTGNELASGTIENGTISETALPGGVYEITLNAGYELTDGTEYVWVFSTDGDGTNRVRVADDYPNNSYSGHNLVSANAGVSWTVDSGYDYYFENWGDISEEEEPTTTPSTLTGDYTESITFLGLIFWIFGTIIIYLLTFIIVLKA